MKLNNIAYAVSISLAALALTACGNSGKKSPTPQTKPQTQQPAPNTGADAKAEAEKKKIAALVELGVSKGLTGANAAKFAQENKDKELGSEALNKALAEAVKKQDAALAGNNKATNPTSEAITKTNPFIDDIDVTKTPTVSTKHYARHHDSAYDRVSNRASMGTSGDSTELTVSNPYLSNFVIGSEADAQDKRFAVDSMGEEIKVTGSYPALSKVKKPLAESKYYKDDFTVYRRNGLGPVVDDAHYEHKIYTIQEVNGSGTAGTSSAAITNFDATRTARTPTGNHIRVLYAPTIAHDVNNAVLKTFADRMVLGTLDSTDVHGTTGLVGYRDGQLAFGAEENVYEYKNGVTKVKDSLFEKVPVGRRVIAKDPDVNGTTGVPYAGSITSANQLSTRVFGKNYRDYEADHRHTQTNNNSYTAELDETGKKLLGNVQTVALHNVQYGRLTSNVDALVGNPDKNKKEHLIYRQFETHGTKGSVDTYFYRGTNETSIEDMKKVKAKGGKLNYYGHAVTYGIGPFVDGSDSNKLPTAYSDKDGKTLGNFVEATYDTATDKVTGSIYNLVTKHDDLALSNHYDVQKLVEFNGLVFGNTVADGVSTKLGATPEKGSFIASFYGSDASEMGGNVSSISKEKGFGENKWGAVFGATLGQTGRNYSTGRKN